MSAIIASGSYGCVFRPGINCNGKTDEDTRYVSKLQSSELVLQNEINIGKKIQTLEDYEEYFSPIIGNCPISMNEIETKEIDKCEPIKKNPANIVINKIKYEGRNTLANYILTLIKENPPKFVELLLETHINLLESLKKLKELEIIHNDIKENNIICRDLDGRPIIIDFGVSIETKFMHLPEGFFESMTRPPSESDDNMSLLFEYFYNYDDSYPVWCIDVIMLNYMLIKLNESWLTSAIKQEDINELLINVAPENREEAEKMFSVYLDQSWGELIKNLRQRSNHDWLDNIYKKYGYKWRTLTIQGETMNEIIDSYLQHNPSQNEGGKELKEYFNTFVDGTWEKLFNELIGHCYTWDVFALSQTYLQIIKMINIGDNDKMVEYEKLLKRNVLSVPNARMTAEEMENELINVLSIVPRTSFEEIVKSVFNSLLVRGRDGMRSIPKPNN